MMGYSGGEGRQAAMYPWTASMVDGHQTTSCVEGWKEQHISLGAANTFVRATVDTKNGLFAKTDSGQTDETLRGTGLFCRYRAGGVGGGAGVRQPELHERGGVAGAEIAFLEPLLY
jgi:hypothetical protein